MNLNFLDFEQPIAELEAKIEELRRVGSDAEVNIVEEIERLESKSRELTQAFFPSLSQRRLLNWLVIRSVHICSTTSSTSLPISRSYTVIVCTAMITRLSEGRPDWMARR